MTISSAQASRDKVAAVNGLMTTTTETKPEELVDLYAAVNYAGDEERHTDRQTQDGGNAT